MIARGAPLAAALRRATVADAPALARVQRASVRALARGAYPPSQLAAWTRLGPLYHRWALVAGGEVAFVAERAGHVVGYAAFTLGPPAEVTAVFVRPAVAGRGVGTFLLARVEAEARRRGARRLVVKASLNGEPFYRARGYGGGRRIRVPLPGGGALAAIRLAKALSPPTARPGS
ncbi:GNAT family N-acetyltransferase [Anaeromyxobacter oryzisoli]|uniref:GNAT family N-acetyltransferase n=1 Tax=Anaeromyxobacter oryzisoli TaxID=2925408 RepID=UPI001F59CF4D|nr:GNAT family N-acetyltransferase [Anaeromyxobacter sp. SG63]